MSNNSNNNNNDNNSNNNSRNRRRIIRLRRTFPRIRRERTRFDLRNRTSFRPDAQTRRRIRVLRSDNSIVLLRAFLTEFEHNFAVRHRQRERSDRMIGNRRNQSQMREPETPQTETEMETINMSNINDPANAFDMLVSGHTLSLDDQESNPLQTHVELPALLEVVRFLAEVRGEQPHHTLYELMRRRDALDTSGSLLDRVWLPLSVVLDTNNDEDDDAVCTCPMSLQRFPMIRGPDTNTDSQSSSNCECTSGDLSEFSFSPDSTSQDESTSEDVSEGSPTDASCPDDTPADLPVDVSSRDDMPQDERTSEDSLEDASCPDDTAQAEHTPADLPDDASGRDDTPQDEGTLEDSPKDASVTDFTPQE